MSDDLTKRGPAERLRVNVHEAWELEWWSAHWGVTKLQVIACVGKIGVMATDVAKCLEK